MTLGILKHVLTVIAGENMCTSALKYVQEVWEKNIKNSVFHLLSAHIKPEYTS